VRELCELAFGYVGLDYRDYVVVDPSLFRPAEVNLLVGDASKARRRLGWEPKVRFEELIKMMVEADLALVAEQLAKREAIEGAESSQSPLPR
jgi:GDPmannose 4,6-dehydratase